MAIEKIKIFQNYVGLLEGRHGNKTVVNGSSWIQPYLAMSKLVLLISNPTSFATVSKIHVDFAVPTLMWLRCEEKTYDNGTVYLHYQFLPLFLNHENCTANISGCRSNRSFSKADTAMQADRGRFVFFIFGARIAQCRWLWSLCISTWIRPQGLWRTSLKRRTFNMRPVGHQDSMGEHVWMGMPRDTFIWICRSLA